MNHEWTEQEIDILNSCDTIYDAEDLLPDHSLLSIRMKGFRLGIKFSNPSKDLTGYPMSDMTLLNEAID